MNPNLLAPGCPRITAMEDTICKEWEKRNRRFLNLEDTGRKGEGGGLCDGQRGRSRPPRPPGQMHTQIMQLGSSRFELLAQVSSPAAGPGGRTPRSRPACVPATGALLEATRGRAS